jgi:N6-L-threonylcarbamoyladenine synthase
MENGWLIDIFLIALFPMVVLSIETSCDETAVAVLKADGEQLEVLSSVVSSQIATHAPYGGVVPMLAAREHAANIGIVFDQALAEAGIGQSDIELIAVTRGPGLGPALLVGLTFARTLAMRLDLPIIGVNHLEGHVYSNWLPSASQGRSKNDELRSSDTSPFTIHTSPFPYLNVVVSGGHTELVLMHGHGAYELIGSTLDDAAGEAFDKVARLLGLPFPGGPEISKLAKQGNPAAFDLPRPMLKTTTLDFSFSGLKTAVLYLVRDLEASAPLSDSQRADVAASFQEAAVDVIAQKARRAAREHGVHALLLSGGVSANPVLRERLAAVAAELDVAYAQPDLAWTGDNAAMIAAAGAFGAAQSGADTSWQNVEMDANLRLG